MTGVIPARADDKPIFTSGAKVDRSPQFPGGYAKNDFRAWVREHS
jgi:hypothetical protein